MPHLVVLGHIFPWHYSDPSRDSSGICIDITNKNNLSLSFVPSEGARLADGCIIGIEKRSSSLAQGSREMQNEEHSLNMCLHKEMVLA